MTIKPSSLRDADIKTVNPAGDFVHVELTNGTSHTLDTEEVIADWLHLHKKLKKAKQWAKDSKE